MVFVEVDQDIGVTGADGCGTGIGGVDAAIRDPDVVDDGRQLPRGDYLTDRGLDAIAQGRGLIDARAGKGPQVQLDLAGVDAGEEVLAKSREDGPERERQNGGQRHRAEEREGE